MIIKEAKISGVQILHQVHEDSLGNLKTCLLFSSYFISRKHFFGMTFFKEFDIPNNNSRKYDQTQPLQSYTSVATKVPVFTP